MPLWNDLPIPPLNECFSENTYRQIRQLEKKGIETKYVLYLAALLHSARFYLLGNSRMIRISKTKCISVVEARKGIEKTICHLEKANRYLKRPREYSKHALPLIEKLKKELLYSKGALKLKKGKQEQVVKNVQLDVLHHYLHQKTGCDHWKLIGRIAQDVDNIGKKDEEKTYNDFAYKIVKKKVLNIQKKHGNEDRYKYSCYLYQNQLRQFERRPSNGLKIGTSKGLIFITNDQLRQLEHLSPDELKQFELNNGLKINIDKETIHISPS